jgi:hypothetical protein
MKEERRRRLFVISPKEEQILVDHPECGIHRSRNRPSANFLKWRRRKKTRTSVPSH